MKVLAACVVLIAGLLVAQAPPPGMVIRGRVVGWETGEPVPHARVVVYSGATPLPPIFTNEQGRFLSAGLAAGRYRLSVTKAGYAGASAAGPDTTAADDLDIRMRRAAAIAGRVVDLMGEPVVDAIVTLGTSDSNRAGGFHRVKSAQTDDLGEYRLGGLDEGTYVLNASLSIPFPVTTFYPAAATLEQADSVTIHPGDEKTGVDFVTPLTVVRNMPLLLTINNGRLQGSGFNANNLTDGSADQGTAAIRGRVLQPSGAAVPHANVVLTGGTTILVNKRFARIGVTDDDGRFAFERLMPGDYRLVAGKTGYVTSDDANRGPNGDQRISLKAGGASNSANVVLVRTGAIVGQVVDEFGDPVEGASMNALKTRYDSGRLHLENVTAMRGTDDRGHYRMHGLQPGRYLVTAAAGQVTAYEAGADRSGHALTYFPGTPNPGDGQLLTVNQSQELANIDLALTPTPTARITGRVLTSIAGSFGGSLWLSPSYRSGVLITPSIGARREADGHFEFPNVSPGEYVIQADEGKRDTGQEGEFVSQFVTVNSADLLDLHLQSAAGSTISGRVTFEGDTATRPRDFAIVPSPADYDLAPRQNGSIARADVRPDLTFVMTGIRGPRRLSVVGLPDTWALKAVIAGGVDVTDVALSFGIPDQSLANVEVILTNRVTELTGSVIGSGGQASANYTLLVFPLDRERWYPGSRYLRRVSSGSAGNFTVRGLPPGAYWIAPVAGISVLDEGDAWQDPGYLESIQLRATHVTLTEKQTLSVRARLITP